MPARILIVEAKSLVRDLLVWLFADQPNFEVVGTAADGKEAVQRADDLCPDVIVMDLRLPVLNGVQATEQILTRHPETLVITLAAEHDLTDLGRLAGAFACLEMNCLPEELQNRRYYEPSNRGFEGKLSQRAGAAFSSES